MSAGARVQAPAEKCYLSARPMAPIRPTFPEPFFTLELEGQRVQRFSLDRPRTSIGRAREAEIQIAVRGVSRLHAAVVRDETGRCTLIDLGSANGTYVNATRIAGDHVLKSGDVINFLDYSLIFHREGEDAADAAITAQLDRGSFEIEETIPTQKGLVSETATGTPLGAGLPIEVEVRDPELGITLRLLDREVTSVGGEPSSNIRLSARRLERHHSLLIRLDEKLLFVRLSPVHIARINGTARMVTFVGPGDVITIGQSTLHLHERKPS